MQPQNNHKHNVAHNQIKQLDWYLPRSYLHSCHQTGNSINHLKISSEDYTMYSDHYETLFCFFSTLIQPFLIK